MAEQPQEVAFSAAYIDDPFPVQFVPFNKFIRKRFGELLKMGREMQAVLVRNVVLDQVGLEGDVEDTPALCTRGKMQGGSRHR